MTALRRDLIERRLWMVIAVLVVAIAAVPVLLLNGSAGNDTATVPVPPSASASTATSPSQSTVDTTPEAVPTKLLPSQVKQLRAELPRDPFSAGSPKLATAPSASSTSSSASASTATSSATTTTASASATPASMVSPTPASSTASTTSTTATTPTSTTASASTSGTSAASSSSSASSPAAKAASVKPATVQSWTTYAVNLRFGASPSAAVRTDVARLTPLPSVKTPAVMFMGVFAGGTQTVFAVRSGIGHTGPGWCRPSHTQCSAIVLKAGQTEHIVVPSASGGQPDQFLLRVTRVTARVTHSHTVALAAYNRHSAAGLCELDMANPVSFSQTDGTVTNVASAACKQQKSAVPFSSYFVTAR